ncbi:CdaR family protein [Paenibacillus humicola]|uniref:CdaR family protein n=1 Tax=Paenibacillus humicola TaxID=3110540 RepID=UPI00237BD580|nr:CdaR family protein [Paenibacillus humicola]
MDKWLSHPTSLKIISLVIGILLWAVVHFDSEKSPNTVASLTETKVIDAVKVEATGLDDKNYALRVIEPSTIRLTVRGTASNLVFATPDDFQVTVDVSGAKEGRQVLPVTVSLPRGIERIGVEPSVVTVELEKMVTKEFEVQITTEGQPANNYKLGEPIVKPNNRVHITLPEDRMDDVGFVGANISVEGEEDTVNEKKLKVNVLDKDGNEMNDAQINPSVVEVEVPITKPFKKLPLQLGLTGKMPDGLAISSFQPSVDQVTIYGPQEMLDRYDFYDGLSIDLSKLKQSGTMELNIPPEDGIASVDPNKVTVDYTVVPAATKVLPQLKVGLIGLSDGLKAKLVTPESGMLDLPIQGAPNMLKDVGVQDVQLIADLSGLGPGSHVVPVEIHLPRFIEDHLDGPLSVTVEITDASHPPDAGQTTGKADSGASTGDAASGTGSQTGGAALSGGGETAQGNDQQQAVQPGEPNEQTGQETVPSGGPNGQAAHTDAAVEGSEGTGGMSADAGTGTSTDAGGSTASGG